MLINLQAVEVIDFTFYPQGKMMHFDEMDLARSFLLLYCKNLKKKRELDLDVNS